MHTISKALALAFAALFSLTAQAHSGHGTAHGQAHGHGHDHGSGQHSAAPSFPDPATAGAPEGVTVGDCWIRALPNRLPAAGYFRLENTSGQDAVLVGAQAEGFGRVMLHTHQTTGGMSSMVHVDRVVVPAGGGFDFAPGGHHVMLEKPTIDLRVGGKRPLVLWFEGDRALTAQCDVRPAGATQ